MGKDSLGDRMKGYEACPKNFLIRRMPVIIRLDGKAFHTLTKKLDKPYDEDFRDIMMKTAEYLVQNVMNCKLAYVQSDEISLLMVDYSRLETEAWYDNNVQKIVSVTASMATAIFNKNLDNRNMFPEYKRLGIKQPFAMFDSRAFNLPADEVTNYFLWRQNDATRNSIQGLGQANFSPKEMKGKRNNVVQDMLMLLETPINWNDVETYFKRGGCVYRSVKPVEGKEHKLIVDMEIPIFSKNREYINQHLVGEE